MRLDVYDKMPAGMREYLSCHGWHFSKQMAEWATSKMYKEPSDVKVYIKPYTKEDVDEMLKKYGIILHNCKGYDYVYIANMCKADFLNSSITDEMHLAKFVKDVIDDSDAYDGMPFTRFYADCIGSGTPINWLDMI